jgi:phage shock protein C
MYCTRCGIELRESDRFCPGCGTRTGAGGPLPGLAPARPLELDKRNKKIAGVCAGFARYFDVDVTLVRVLWLAAALMTGLGFIAYLAAWIVIPSDNGLEPRPVAAPSAQPN